MDISKITSAVEQIGYNPFGISGTDEKSIQEFAQDNNISFQEAEAVLKEAESKAEENDKMSMQMSESMLQMLNSQDSEEIELVEDADFDKFLKEQSPEQKMQEIFANQQFVQNDNSGNKFSQDNNPFLTMKWN